MSDFFRWPNRHDDEFLTPAQRARLDGNEERAEKLEAEEYAALATRLGWHDQLRLAVRAAELEALSSAIVGSKAGMDFRGLEFNEDDLPRVHAEHDQEPAKW